MPFIGNQPALNYTSFAKQDFTTSATTSYTLDNPVTNENELALFINFVRQEPTTAYTASGTSLTLTSATSASDDMYCVFLGKAVQTVNPPAGSVGASQIADSSIALEKLSATGTKDATTFLRGDNSFQEVPSGLGMADQWRFSTNFTSSGEKINTGWERNDNSFYGGIGTGMTESSGDFTFPSTGIYYISFVSSFNASAFRSYAGLKLRGSSDGGSNYSDLIDIYDSISSSGEYGNVNGNYLLDVTNVSNIKVALYTSASGAVTYEGHSTYNRSYMTFLRLGDT
nr:hypothetical protein [uncultured Mediterranean phage uvMED]